MILQTAAREKACLDKNFSRSSFNPSYIRQRPRKPCATHQVLPGTFRGRHQGGPRVCNGRCAILPVEFSTSSPNQPLQPSFVAAKRKSCPSRGKFIRSQPWLSPHKGLAVVLCSSPLSRGSLMPLAQT